MIHFPPSTLPPQNTCKMPEVKFFFLLREKSIYVEREKS